MGKLITDLISGNDRLKDMNYKSIWIIYEQNLKAFSKK